MTHGVRMAEYGISLDYLFSAVTLMTDGCELNPKLECTTWTEQCVF